MTVPRELITAFTRSDNKEHYSLGQLWFLLSNPDLKFPDYIKKARTSDFTTIFVKDTEEIKQYFFGLKAQSDLIDELFRPKTLIKRSHLKSGKVNLETQQK